MQHHILSEANLTGDRSTGVHNVVLSSLWPLDSEFLKRITCTGEYCKAFWTPSIVIRASKVRVCLVREMKIFGYHIGCFGDVGRGFSDTNKKTNYIARLETAR